MSSRYGARIWSAASSRTTSHGRTVRTAGARARVRLLARLHDEGPGIDAKDAELLFQRGVRGDGAPGDAALQAALVAGLRGANRIEAGGTGRPRVALAMDDD